MCFSLFIFSVLCWYRIRRRLGLRNVVMWGVILCLLVLWLCRSSECLPRPGNSPDIYNSWKHCVDPQKCCRHIKDSLTFQQCCHDNGCCTKFCDDPSEGIRVEAVIESCPGGWSCCRFRLQTPEFRKCCEDHGCCPECGGLPKGCCYNGVVYQWGSVVENLPEVCLQLVCVARVLAIKTFSAAILPIRLPSHFCKGGDWCNDCLTYSCVDDTGLLQAEGVKWSPDECQECVCRNGLVTCRQLVQWCPPPPHGHCLEIPGVCCPTWNCTVSLRLCVDKEGGQHDLGSVWKPNPCVTYRCTPGGIQTDVQPCILGYPTHPNCRKYTPAGECCPSWNCSGCVDSDGQPRIEGETWQEPVDPCTRLECMEGAIVTSQVQCDAESPPYRGCVPKRSPGQCCPLWQCPDTVYYDLEKEVLQENPYIGEEEEEYSYTDVEEDDPKTGVSPRTRQWPHKPWVFWLPQQGIKTLLTVGHKKLTRAQGLSKVCELWKLKYLGKKWKTSDPCKVDECTRTGIQRRDKKCKIEVPRHPDCYQYTPDGQCCLKFDCSRCHRAGKFYKLNSVAGTGDPCLTLHCSENGLREITVSCQVDPAPDINCFKYKPGGECCEKWNCSGCLVAGRFYVLGSETNTADPCITSRCTETGMTYEYKRCPWIPPPKKNCFKYVPEGECCEQWNCRGCYEDEEYYEVNSTAPSKDPCIISRCTETGMKYEFKHCPWIPPPKENCFRYLPRGECCEKWKCSDSSPSTTATITVTTTTTTIATITAIITTTTATATTTTSTTTITTSTTTITPTTSSASMYPLVSGCVDSGGQVRKRGDVWRDADKPCLKMRCGMYGTMVDTSECYPENYTTP